MASESFTDSYGTKVIIQNRTGWDHIQLLLIYQDGSEPTSYGFTKADFEQFYKHMTLFRNSFEEYPDTW